MFRALARGFPWAWDEEVAAGAAHRPAHQGVRLAVAFPVVADANVEAALRRGVRAAVVQEGGPEHERAAKDVAVQGGAQGAAQREPRGRKGMPGVPQRVPLWAQASREALAQRVLLQEPQEARQAKVSPPQARVHDVLVSGPPGPEQAASRLAVGARVRGEEQQAPLPEQGVGAKLPSRPLLWQRARLRPHFPRLPHL